MAGLIQGRTVGPHQPAHARRASGQVRRNSSRKSLTGPALSSGQSLPQRMAVWSAQHPLWAAAAWLIFVLVMALAAAGLGLWAADRSALPDPGLVREVMVLVGLAVGVTYVLVYWRRFGEELQIWGDGLTAIEAAANTVGRSVMVSGAGMVLVLAATLSLGNAGLSAIGVGAILALLAATAFAVTVLPALMTALAKSAERPRPPFLARPVRDRQPRVMPKLIDQVFKHPAVWLAAGLVVVGLLAIPALTRSVGLPDGAAQVAGTAGDNSGGLAQNAADAAYSLLHLVAFIAIVAAVMLAVMCLVYRSLAIGLATVVFNMVSAAAACGVVALVFQRIHGSASNGTVTAWVPPLLFVLLCGQSLIFREIVLARIQEDVAAGMDSREAVHSGLARTASVVTSAAAVMAGVCAIFGILGRVEFRQLGLGLATGIALDATVIRIVALPAFMVLAERFLWWPGVRAQTGPTNAPGHLSDADTNTEELDVVPDPAATLAAAAALTDLVPAALEPSSASIVTLPAPSSADAAPTQPFTSPSDAAPTQPFTSPSDAVLSPVLSSPPQAPAVLSPVLSSPPQASALPPLIPSVPPPALVDPPPPPPSTAFHSGLPVGSLLAPELAVSPSPTRPTQRQADWWTDPGADGWTPQSLAAAEWRRSRPWLIGQVLVDVENLTAFQDARPAAEAVTFQLRSAEILALIGPPDGGAAAVGRVLAGRGVARKGTVTVLGETIPTGARVPGDRIVSAPADAVIDSGRSVWDNLIQALARAGLDRAEQSERLAGLVDRFMLSDVVDIRASRLDKADRKLLGLAACVAARPQVAVFTAPTADLDFAQRLAVEEAIAELAWAGAGIIIVPTTAAEAETLASTVLVIGQTVLAHGSIPDILKRFAPASDLTVSVRSVADLSQLAGLLTRMGVEALQIDPQTRTVKAHLAGGADGLAQVIFRIKVAAIDTVSVSLTTPSLADALAAIPAGQPAS